MNDPTGKLDTSPWDALLTEVKRTAYRVAYIDHRATDEHNRESQLRHEYDTEADRREHNAEVRRWLDQSRRERAHLLKVSKAAIDAGLSERYLHSIQVEAEMIARVVNRSINVLDITYEQRELVAMEMREALMDVSAELYERHGLSSTSITPGEDNDES